jgi:hypothetical protein
MRGYRGDKDHYRRLVSLACPPAACRGLDALKLLRERSFVREILLLHKVSHARLVMDRPMISHITNMDKTAPVSRRTVRRACSAVTVSVKGMFGGSIDASSSALSSLAVIGIGRGKPCRHCLYRATLLDRTSRTRAQNRKCMMRTPLSSPPNFTYHAVVFGEYRTENRRK